jgi:arylsulfatase A-like enzyme
MSSGCHKKTAGTDRPNILFIFIDDLRPEAGCYGNSLMVTPAIDKIAAEGICFTGQFVAVPTCGASRFCMLTGQLPHTLTATSNEACHQLIANKPAEERPVTFMERLRKAGYYTVGIGKISHYADGYVYPYDGTPQGAPLELPGSWDEMLFDPGKWGTGWNAFFGYADGSNRNGRNKEVKPYERGNVDDNGYPDGLTAQLALKKLRELAGKKQPFLLAVGFFKPHLPFNSPSKYWDLYDESSIPLTPSPNIPENVNTASLHQSGEFNQYKLGEEHPSLSKPVSDAYARKIRHAYYSAVSYTDAQIAKLMTELEELNMKDNTIVILWGDHGWHLGDDRVWGKHTIFEWALRSLFVVRAPGYAQNATCNKVVSAIDIYPTILELCSLPAGSSPEGKSLVPLLKNPEDPQWDNVAYSYYRHGITLRTQHYRLTKYFRDQQPVIELYDHQSDPYENVNIAETHQDIVNELMPLWQKGNTGIYQ